MELVYRQSTPVTINHRTIEGTAIVFYDGTPNTEYDLAAYGLPGVFERMEADSFKLAPTVFAYSNHNSKDVLGKTPNTLELWTDTRGLHYKITLPRTQAANDLLAHFEIGNIGGSSFGMTQPRYQFKRENNRDIAIVRDVTIHEISPVFEAAYKQTTASVRTALTVWQGGLERLKKLEALKLNKV